MLGLARPVDVRMAAHEVAPGEGRGCRTAKAQQVDRAAVDGEVGEGDLAFYQVADGQRPQQAV